MRYIILSLILTAAWCEDAPKTMTAEESARIMAEIKAESAAKKAAKTVPATAAEAIGTDEDQRKAFNDAIDAMDKERHLAEARCFDRISPFLLALKPVDPEKPSIDPRKSELDRSGRVNEYNGLVAALHDIAEKVSREEAVRENDSDRLRVHAAAAWEIQQKLRGNDRAWSLIAEFGGSALTAKGISDEAAARKAQEMAQAAKAAKEAQAAKEAREASAAKAAREKRENEAANKAAAAKAKADDAAQARDDYRRLHQ